jgi:sensor domain CHASE-containing protein
LRDHHILHAAHGTAHVWPAAIVAGLAVVVTVTLAFAAAQARTAAEIDAASKSLRSGLGRDVNGMVLEIQDLKKQLSDMSASCTRSGR